MQIIENIFLLENIQTHLQLPNTQACINISVLVNLFSTQRAGLLTAYSKSGRFSQLERQTHSILTTELRLPVRHGGVGSQKTKMPMLTQLGMLSNKVLLL